MSLPPTRYFYQVKYARGYPFVPVKLAGRVYRGAAMIEESQGLRRESNFRRLLRTLRGLSASTSAARPGICGDLPMRRLDAGSPRLANHLFNIFSRFDQETSYELDGRQFFDGSTEREARGGL
jgi:hypothetical protein